MTASSNYPTTRHFRRRRTGYSRIRRITFTALVMCPAWIGAKASATSVPEPSDPTEPSLTSAPPDSISGSFDIGDREMFLECTGSGSPTVIFEPGEGEDHTTFASLQDQVSRKTSACVYDRANVGASGSAPTPRTGDDIVEDLRLLLNVADVEGPYVLVGSSAGATVVLHHARSHPDDVVGVLAMNPVPVASEWVARAYPLLSAEEVAGEEEYYAGANGESIDYTATYDQQEALPIPDGVSLILWHSTVTQCEGEVGGPCAKTADLYVELGEEYAAAWPSASFEAVDLRHAIHFDDEARVLVAIDELVTGSVARDVPLRRPTRRRSALSRRRAVRSADDDVARW